MINIKIKDNDGNRRKYATVALTVDRDEFLDAVFKLRIKYKIDYNIACPHYKFNKRHFEELLNSKLINNSQLLRLWFAEFFNILPTIIKDNRVYEPNTELQLQENMNLTNRLRHLIYGNNNKRKIAQEFQEDIVSIRKRLNLTPRMDRVIEHATLCNVVKDEDLLLAHGSLELAEGISDLSLFKCFNIQVSLEATQDDIVEAYKRDILPLQLKSWGIDTTLPITTLPSIRIDRERFWKNKRGYGHVYITADETVGINNYKKARRALRKLKDYNDRNSRIEAENIIEKVEDNSAGVKKSLQRYKKLLNSTVKNLLK